MASVRAAVRDIADRPSVFSWKSLSGYKFFYFVLRKLLIFTLQLSGMEKKTMQGTLTLELIIRNVERPLFTARVEAEEKSLKNTRKF